MTQADSAEAASLMSVLEASLSIGTNLWQDDAHSVNDYVGVVTNVAKSTCAPVLIDTAEVYTNGASERAVGLVRARAEAEGVQCLIMTKHLPLPWHLNARAAVFAALRKSLE
eukprot:4632606-Amphidinium_carterae.1